MSEKKPLLQYGRGRAPMATHWRVVLWIVVLASLAYLIWFAVAVWYRWANSARE